MVLHYSIKLNTYRLKPHSGRYNDNNGRTLSKDQIKIGYQIKLHQFDSDDPITLVSFLEAFKSACDGN